jgi:hypothetical protein
MTDRPVVMAQKQSTPVPVPVAPKPVTPAPVVTAPPAPAPAATTTPSVGTARTIGDLPFNSVDIGVISGITVLVALVALIPKGLITRHLVSRRATPGAAGAAAWSAWFLIVVTAAFCLIGTLGHLWTVLLFYGPIAALSVFLLILTVVLFSRALNTHR